MNNYISDSFKYLFDLVEHLKYHKEKTQSKLKTRQFDFNRLNLYSIHITTFHVLNHRSHSLIHSLTSHSISLIESYTLPLILSQTSHNPKLSLIVT